jgi:hypothetical protein
LVIVTVIKPPPKAAGYVENGVITDCGRGDTGVLGARGCGWTGQENDSGGGRIGGIRLQIHWCMLTG